MRLSHIPLIVLAAGAALAVAGPAPAELAVVSKVPAQQPFGDRLEVHSDALGRDMIVTVTPPLTGLPKGEKVPAIYALDEGYGVAGPAGSAMAGGGAMAPALVVAVGWVPGQWDKRDEDLLYGAAAYDGRSLHGRGPAFEAFLLQELKPFIERTYPADPARAVLFGHSSGGNFAAEILGRKPDAFSAYVIGSPAFWVDTEALPAVTQAVRSGAAKQVFVAAGGAETPVMLRDEAALVAALTAPGSRMSVRSHVYAGARHGGYFTPLFAESFPWLLPPPAEQAEVPVQVLAGYAGAFRLPDGRVLRITARGGQLFADMAGFAERELLAVDRQTFRLPDAPIRYRFTEGGKGVVMHANGADTPGQRIGTPGA
ncbi:alpha/beta hydrolase [Phenylobacterium sp.]|uniref:alpha/beta hydrolase n=1 Tax=Phenylobacterium sp. TaxID=1871053 RepID=UPI002F3E5192